MQMGAGDPAGGTGQTDDLTFGNRMIGLDIDAAEMGVGAENSGAMVDDDDLAGKKNASANLTIPEFAAATGLPTAARKSVPR